MMGRPKEEDDSTVPTVGMYGIGMKRAIFKMGRSSTVISQTENETFEVKISPTWLEDNDDWDLPLRFIDPQFEGRGTRITVDMLREGISKSFDTSGSSNFINDFINIVSQHYAVIIKKGFKVFLNGELIRYKNFSLLWANHNDNLVNNILPYIYMANIDGLDIKLAIGFYRPMLSQEEVDEEQVARRSTDDAGITIICNDRVVLYNDKSRLTGWGEATVPSYHTQFIGIAGVVQFQSNDAWKLPITTTKRGVDTSSDIYLYIKGFIREGLKKFTSYTNEWKINPEQERKISSEAQSQSLENIFNVKPDKSWVKVKHRENEVKLNIPLPKPDNSNPHKQIRYSKSVSEIEIVSDYIFGNSDVKPSEIGEKCFDIIFEKAKK